LRGVMWGGLLPVRSADEGHLVRGRGAELRALERVCEGEAVSGRPSIESFAPLQASTDLGKERDGAEGAAETALLQ
jgi:hypothetical protein